MRIVYCLLAALHCTHEPGVTSAIHAPYPTVYKLLIVLVAPCLVSIVIRVGSTVVLYHIPPATGVAKPKYHLIRSLSCRLHLTTVGDGTGVQSPLIQKRATTSVTIPTPRNAHKNSRPYRCSTVEFTTHRPGRRVVREPATLLPQNDPRALRACQITFVTLGSRARLGHEAM